MSELIITAGARPNFMKIAPLLWEGASRQLPFALRLVHTGQHYDAGMSDVFFQQLDIPAPDVQLGVGSGTHGQQTARALEAFEGYLIGLQTPPAGVVVVGDINSTLACSLAAVKLGIPVVHVEAGLRSHDRTMPEEINRLVTDVISDFLFVSEPAGTVNLRNEGIPEHRIRFVGNLMIDTLVRELKSAAALRMCDRTGVKPKSFILVTLHRPSNVDDQQRLADIVEFLLQIARQTPVVFPIHPRTRERAEKYGLLSKLEQCPTIHLLSPLGYRENLSLMSDATAVLTDSGGIQEETTFLDVPCLTLRPNTERPVTVTSGTNTIVGDDLHFASRLLEKILQGERKTTKPIPGWDGHAAQRALDILVAELG